MNSQVKRSCHCERALQRLTVPIQTQVDAPITVYRCTCIGYSRVVYSRPLPAVFMTILMSTVRISRWTVPRENRMMGQAIPWWRGLPC